MSAQAILDQIAESLTDLIHADRKRLELDPGNELIQGRIESMLRIREIAESAP